RWKLAVSRLTLHPFLQVLSSSLGPLPSPLSTLGPLRGPDLLGQGPLSGSAPSVRGSLSSSGGLEPLKTSFPGPRSGGATSVLVTRKEERISFTLPGLESDEEDHDDDQKQISENELSPRGSDRLLKNLLDSDALGGGLHYEDSEASAATPDAERTEPELQNLAPSGDHSLEPPSHQVNPQKQLSVLLQFSMQHFSSHLRFHL
ncbi:PREDICTED: uncharacterized protein LOC107081329, partial [Cyprinodon variegatus]|uniref:uncharacterized protein LOC107081329 n=1 Tax=Cyprinodon variegatus TaxID=28743 RepID=UPI000742AD1E